LFSYYQTLFNRAQSDAVKRLTFKVDTNSIAVMAQPVAAMFSLDLSEIRFLTEPQPTVMAPGEGVEDCDHGDCTGPVTTTFLKKFAPARRPYI
jgi:hypothetical protein